MTAGERDIPRVDYHDIDVDGLPDDSDDGEIAVWDDDDDDGDGGEPSYDITDRATGKPRMCAEMCATCIMRPAPAAIALPPGRLKQFIAQALTQQSYVICHSTFCELPAACRGFADRYDTNWLRVMRRLGGFVEIEPPRS